MTLKESLCRNPNGPSTEEKELMAGQLQEMDDEWLRRKQRPVKWFIMLRNADGTPVPMINLAEDVVLFDSLEDAIKAGSANPIGEAYGFEYYAW
jgi:hypothetical protein